MREGEIGVPNLSGHDGNSQRQGCGIPSLTADADTKHTERRRRYARTKHKRELG